jgi:SOS response regulatory protein OraA/RecX
MIKLDILAHKLYKDGYQSEIIDEIIDALKTKRDLDDFKKIVES